MGPIIALYTHSYYYYYYYYYYNYSNSQTAGPIFKPTMVIKCRDVVKKKKNNRGNFP